MKKGLLSALLAVCAFCLALQGCAGAPAGGNLKNFVGVWEVNSLSTEENSLDAEGLSYIKAFGMNIYFIVDNSGKTTFDMYGEQIGGQLTPQSASEATLVIESEDKALDQKSEVKLTEDKLLLSSGTTSMEFTRSSQQAMDDFKKNGGTLSSELANPGTTVDKEATLIDDEKVVVKTKRMVADDSSLTVYFDVTNKTNDTVKLFADGDFKLNGTEHETLFSTEVAAGETKEDYFRLKAEKADPNNAKIEGRVHLEDKDYKVLKTVDVKL